jgi:hypothetical protein
MPENGIPDTMSYLILALAAVAIIMGALVASIVVRYANLRRDIETLRQLNPDDI